MAVVAGVAEHGNLAERLTTQSGRGGTVIADVQGHPLRYRSDPPGCATSLAKEIERGLDLEDVTFDVPGSTDRHEHQGRPYRMMASFEAVHPDQGLLFVLDEMLEYLKGGRKTRS